jgi:sialate O-acetylesterase
MRARVKGIGLKILRCLVTTGSLQMLVIGWCAVLPLSAHADVRLPKVLSDHAVLQRERPIHIWGWATPGAHLRASLNHQARLASADSLGRWSLYLDPEPAGGPYKLSVEGDGPAVVVNDLLIGDVWLASGQSNMQMPLAGFPPSAEVKDAEKEIAAANNPRLRLLVVAQKTADYPLNDISSTWTECTPATARNFSAVAYFFGREIAARENVPIGLVDSTWGGTPASSWVSLDTLGTSPDLLSAFASRATFANGQADLEATIAAEKLEDERAKAAGKPVPSHPWHPDEMSWTPTAIYNGMIAPLTPLTIKGFLWYQGETDSSHDRAGGYAKLFSALIGDWRAHFAQGNLPFLYVQISSFSSPGEDWGMVRDQQRRALSVAGTAMAVSLDVGKADNVHPPDKQTVAARLALAARATVYGERVPDSGPAFREATVETGADGTVSMRAWFDHGEGLYLGGKPEEGFELAGADHRFMAAVATVEGQTIRVTSPQVPNPKYVRYGWMSVVTNPLFNAAHLPAPTFTSEASPKD